MSVETKILLLEHNIHDIELIGYELEKSDIVYQSILVKNEIEFKKALTDFAPDIILSDYSLPSFDGTTAFKIKEEMCPNIPFILVSGSVGEEKAVELIKSGITDYVLKDKLFTLASKITRSLKEAAEKREKQIIDEKLRKANNLNAFISQVNQNIVRVKDEVTLFRNSCELAIEFGKFKMSWIGLFNFQKETISLIQQCGIVVEDLKIFADAPYQATGPQDYVLQNDAYFLCNDIQHELELVSWKPFALRRGINSCMVLPIKKSGRTIGTFNLYSSELNFSGEEEIKLLVQLADDISFALDLFDKAAQFKKTSELLIDNEKKFRHTLDNMLEGIQIHDFNFRYLYVNDILVKSSTYSREELIGFTLMEKYPGIEQSELFKSIERCMKERKSERLDTTFVFPDGSKTDFELSIEPIPEGVTILSIDRTEQNKAKQKLLKVNRLYAFISAINQSIVHIDDEQTLLNNACKIAVDIGQFKMSWIDLIDEQSGKLNMVSLSGIPDAAETFQKFSGMNYKDPALSGTPTGLVFATGKYSVCNDLQKDPSIIPWRKELIEHEIKAGMCLPLTKFGRVVGVFGFYSAVENIFDEDEIELLEEATGDISFALENFEKARRHKVTEELVLKNEKRFRSLVEQGTDGVAIFSADGNIVYSSPSVERILGYSEMDVLKLNMLLLAHPDDKTGLASVWEQVLASPGIPITGHTGRLKHKDGSWRWLEATVTNMLHDPSINGIVDNFRDVTDRVRAEEEKGFNSNNLNALINNTGDLMWSVDRNFKLITSNEPFNKMIAMSGIVIPKGGDILSGALSEEQSVRFKSSYERAFAGETFTELEHNTLPAEYWMEVSFRPIFKDEEVIGSACYSRDITEKKKAEQKLIKSEAFNRGVLDSLNSHIAVVDQVGEIVAVNESWTRFAIKNGTATFLSTGVSANYYTVCERAANNGVKEAAEVLQGIKDVMNGHRSIFYLEYPCHSPAEKRWFGMRVLKFDSDEPMVVVAHQNITERRLAEENLIQSELRLNEAQAIAHLGNWEINFSTWQVLWSEEACRIYGLSPEKNIQTYSTWISFVHPEDLEYVKRTTSEAEKTMQDVILNHRIVLKNGSIRHIHSKGKFKFNKGKPTGIYGIVLDITERKLADVEREKMTFNIVQHSKNLEQFASVVSHNLRAPVANILGLANVLKGTISKVDRERAQEYLFTATRSLDEIVTDLNKILQVRAEINEYKETVYFDELVISIKSSIQNVIEKESVEIITDFKAISNITSIKSYLYSIFYNLISNGIKYRQEGKTPVISIQSVLANDKIRIFVRDNGIGIDLIKYGDQLFGLYKRFHLNIEGKGLGLFMVKTHIETLGGTIKVESKPGQGTEFVIELPLS